MKKIHRFFYNFDKIEGSFLEVFDYEIVNQIVNVLKIRKDENIIVFNNELELLCSLGEFNQKGIVLYVLEQKKIEKEDYNVNLYCSILKKDNFEFVVEKSVELGISDIYPIITSRTIKTNLNFERLNKIIKEASEQSGGFGFSNVFAIEDLRKVKINGNDLNIAFNMDGNNILENIMEIKKSKNINLFIGPEGGWTDDELFFFKKNNFKIVSLGKNVLRAETAVVLSVGVVSLIKNNS